MVFGKKNQLSPGHEAAEAGGGRGAPGGGRELQAGGGDGDLARVRAADVHEHRGEGLGGEPHRHAGQPARLGRDRVGGDDGQPWGIEEARGGGGYATTPGPKCTMQKNGRSAQKCKKNAKHPKACKD